MEKLMVRVEDAAEALALSRAMVYRLMVSGEIPFVKCGRARLIPIAGVEAYANRLMAESIES